MRAARRWLSAGAVAACFAGATVAEPVGSAPMATPLVQAQGPVWPVSHDGRWLTDSLGRVVLLHGVNMVSKGLPSPAERGFGVEDIGWLADNGFDVVRLGLTAAALMPQPGVIDQQFLDSFAATVHDLTARGILVLVDLHQDGWSSALCLDGFADWMTITHGAPNTGDHGLPWCYLNNPAVSSAFQSLWDNEAGPGGVGLADRVGEMFAALADAVGDDPGLLGYDLINEPWAGTDSSSCYQTPDGCPDLDMNRLGAYYARMASVIRARDRTHLLFAEPGAVFALGLAATHVPVPAGELQGGMAFHNYGQTGGFRTALMANARTWAAQTGGALILGELGAIPDPARIDGEVNEADTDLVPWIWWSYADNDGGGALIRDLGSAPAEANLYTEKVDVLVRPHPVAVAGTPVSLHFDQSTRRMDFAFTTTGPGSRHYPEGTVSLFDVPARPYPGGWHAIISGGYADATGDPSHLAVIAVPGATCVSVTVLPGTGPVVTGPPIPADCPAVVSTTSPAPTTPPSPTTPPTNGVDASAAVPVVDPRFTG